MLHHLLRAATYLAVFWMGFRSVNVAFAVMAQAPWTRANANLAGLLPVGRKVAKVVLLALGGVAVLNELGFQVASLLAGLGIGGIALALAAQKTVENLFGSLSIGVDQPFRTGDFVKIEDFVGTVERIGMRSTRIRTLDRTIITIPNGKLSDMRTETFAPRDRIRLLANLGLVYSTSAAQMREVLAGIERALRAQPKLWPESVSVRFTRARRLGAERRGRRLVRDLGLLRVHRHPPGALPLVHGGGGARGDVVRVPHPHAAPRRSGRGRAAARRAHVGRARVMCGKERGPDVSAGPSRIGGAERDRTDDL